jgi:hypothetical protein
MFSLVFNYIFEIGLLNPCTTNIEFTNLLRINFSFENYSTVSNVILSTYSSNFITTKRKIRPVLRTANQIVDVLRNFSFQYENMNNTQSMTNASNIRFIKKKVRSNVFSYQKKNKSFLFHEGVL